MLRPRKHAVIGLAALLGLLVSGGAFGQTPIPAVNDGLTAEEKIVWNAHDTLDTLEAVLNAREEIRRKIREYEEALQYADSEDEKTRIQDQISELHARARASDYNFETIATGVDPGAIESKSSTEFNWQVEVQEIIGPIIEELKSLTARPREIERLRNAISTYTQQQNTINEALDNLLILKQYARTSEMVEQLTAIEEAWIDREKTVSNQLDITRHHLEEKLRSEQSLADSAQQLVRNFFSSRGRNVLLAVAVFVGVLLLLRYLYPFFVKISPFHQQRKRTFYGRLIDVLYALGTLLGATFALIVVLYAAADWVLLGLVLILLMGLLWAARQGLPAVWEQVKLVLNLSTVREHERVLYNGLPWRVQSLNLYTRFHNPALKGGLIRLPLRDLIGLQSRPSHKDEPWFPTQEGDWVLLDDGTFGTVLMQTPEIVQLRLLGGSVKTYPTLSFVEQNPIDLSRDFRVNVTFGVDYAHQAISTQEVPAKLEARLRSDLERAGYREQLTHLAVEFKEAGASSLDMAILADFSSAAAQDYERLKRLLQRIAVDACNEHGWVIPFAQITVHQASA